MTEPDPERKPVAPALLGRDAAYYREKAADVAAVLDSLSDSERTPDNLGRLDRQHALWTQLADELDAYLTSPDDSPGLF